MPHACIGATSAFIGGCLIVFGGFEGHSDQNPSGNLSTVQIYDIALQAWRLGAPIPDCERHWESRGFVLDGKYFWIAGVTTFKVYNPQSNAWTVEETKFPWQDDMAPWPVVRAVPHQGRIVVFLSNGTAFERDTDGSWSRYKVARGSGFCYGYKGGFAASVLLG